MSSYFLQTSEVYYRDFLEITKKIQKLGELLGKTVTPVHRLEDPHFLRLHVADQQAVLERLKIYHQLFAMVTEPGAQQISEKRLLWLALKLLKFIPSSDLMNMIDEEDFVEVYVGHRQVYRSFNYYDICSYSLDELESVPWPNLFCREDDSITNDILSEIQTVIDTKKPVFSKIPEHIVSETTSPFQNKISYALKCILPLKDGEMMKADCYVPVITARVQQTLSKVDRIARMKAFQDRIVSKRPADLDLV